MNKIIDKAIAVILIIFWFVAQAAIVCFFTLAAIKFGHWWIVLFSIPCVYSLNIKSVLNQF